MKKITNFDLSALNSIQRQAEEMRKLTDPLGLQRHAEEMRRLTDPLGLQRHAEEMRKLTDPLGLQRQAEEMRRLTDPLGLQHQVEEMRKLTDQFGLQRQAEEMRKLNDQFGLQRQVEEMRKLTDQFNIPALKSLQSKLRISALEDIKQQTDLIRSLSSSFDSSLLSGSIAATLSINSVDISNFEEVISETAENSSDLTEFFETLIAWVDDYIPTDNFFKNLIVTVIVSYFMSVWAPIHLNPWSDEERRKLIKDIRQEIEFVYSPDEIKDYRYVTAKSGLLVRSDSNKKGEIVGGLIFGSLVTLIKKSDNNDWSFIEDENGNKGWVYSRYLKKFK